MDAFWISYGVEWMSLIVRWLHLVTGIAWIGASFYFVWLDNSLTPTEPGSDLQQKGVIGELWAVHGGGFYNPQKYLVAPKNLPSKLHWFKWEAYSTWLSGFALLSIVYYFNASGMMIDRAIADIAPWQAISIGIAALVLAWLVYDGLCRSALGAHPIWFGLTIFLLLTAAAYGLSTWLSGRAAYIHIGAMIGTIMVGNVLMVIIPGQKKMVAAMKAGNSPDPIYGQRGKQRSIHNNYFTLPVLFIMISNHYAMTYSNAYGWLVLAAIMAAGVSIRHFFNLRHRGVVAWRFPAIGVGLLVLVAVAIAPVSPNQLRSSSAQFEKDQSRFATVQAIIQRRCVACHATSPTQPGYTYPPGGVMLDSAESIHRNAGRIVQQSVHLKIMPMGNVTEMTDEERALIGKWFDDGAK